MAKETPEELAEAKRIYGDVPLVKVQMLKPMTDWGEDDVNGDERSVPADLAALWVADKAAKLI